MKVICKKKLGIFIVLLFVLFIIMGFAMIGRCFHLEDAWIDFLGACVGVIGSAGISLYVLYNQRDEDRNQSTLPVISVLQKNGYTVDDNITYTIDYVKWNGNLSAWILNDPQHEAVKTTVQNKTEWFHTEIIIKNIGKAPIMRLRVYIVGKTVYESTYEICLSEQDVARYGIYIRGDELHIDEQKNSMVFCFENVYQKKYYQTIDFMARKDNGNFELRFFDAISPLREGLWRGSTLVENKIG